MPKNVVEVVNDATGNKREVKEVFEIDYNSGNAGRIRDNPSLGEATIVASNSPANRDIESGDQLTIKSNGVVDFTGYVTNQPSKTNIQSPELTIKVLDKRSELKYQKVNRPFYQMDSADIVRNAVKYRAEPLSEKELFVAENLNNWDSNVNFFSLGNVGNPALTKRGGDFVFIGWQRGATGTYHATYDAISSSTIYDGNFERVDVRMLLNNKEDAIRAEIELRDYSDNNYNWTIVEGGGGSETEIGGGGGFTGGFGGTSFQRYQLKPENADPSPTFGTSLLTDGAIRFRFQIDSELPEPRAAAIDFASVIPFERTTRDTDIDVSGVESRSPSEKRVITRRFDGTVRKLIQTLSTEEGYVSRIGKDDVLSFQPVGDRTAPENIDFSSTNVVKAEFDRDYQRIKNKVRVQGAGNVRVTVEDSASIDFYGISSREEAIVDKSIQTDAEAEARGRGYLNKHAWHEGAITFEVADSDYQRIFAGDRITVDWPPENVFGNFLVNNVSTDNNGIVTIELAK